jgi:tRNA-2-methylthio-N6-dimethylallyladenosine synthase
MVESAATPVQDPCIQPARRVHVITYGCQMNVHDSRRIVQVLGGHGYAETQDPALADLILVNTCSVRDRPEKKVMGTLTRLAPLKQNNPGLVLGVCGCVAQQHGPDLLAKVPWLDLVFGPDNIKDLPELLGRVSEGGRVANTMHMERTAYDFPDVDASAEPGPTAFLTVMKGCDRFCAYCIVPFVRGREVSKSPERIEAEAVALVAGGVREITLLGQNVNSYGRGLPEPVEFVDLLDRLDRIPGLRRLRFVTSHPADAGDRLLDAFGRLPSLAESLHLPLQSGSDRILAAMNRGYTAARFLDRVERVRAACPDVALSTDIIVGFSGETEDDFRETIRVVQAARFDQMYSFKYSPRPGTRAALRDDDVSPEDKARRLAELQALQDRITAERMLRLSGRIEEVLVEGPSRDQAARGAGRRAAPGTIEWFGRTRTNFVVNFLVEQSELDRKGRLALVRIDEVLAHCFRGTLVEWVRD